MLQQIHQYMACEYKQACDFVSMREPSLILNTGSHLLFVPMYIMNDMRVSV